MYVERRTEFSQKGQTARHSLQVLQLALFVEFGFVAVHCSTAAPVEVLAPAVESAVGLELLRGQQNTVLAGFGSAAWVSEGAVAPADFEWEFDA